MLAGRAWVGGRLQTVEVGVGEDGTITALGKDLTGDRRHDVGQSVILPSGLDVHAHFREPTAGERVESVDTGTLQAAYGGIGAVVDMPNTDPPITTVERLEEKRRRAQGRLAVDLLLYAALTVPERVPALARVAAGFKLYLSPTTGIDPPPRPERIRPLLSAASVTQLPVAVHAEDPRRFRPTAGGGDDGTVAWNAARPPEAEEAAVDGLLMDAPPGLRLHVAHVTLPAVADRLRRAGQSFEASPQHLLLSAGPGADARWKVNPPLRPPPAASELWQRFRSGRVPIVASDHAPHSAEEKARPFAAAPSGMPGVETMLPLLLARVRESSLDLPVLVAAAADRPARLLGLPQGRLVPGHRANLLVVDFRAVTQLRAARLHAPCGWTAFDRWPAIFPAEHYLDGRAIVSGGEYVGAHDGRVVRPAFAPGAARPATVEGSEASRAGPGDDAPPGASARR